MTKFQTKKVMAIGGAGEIGEILVRNFPRNFEVTVADRAKSPPEFCHSYVQLDATEYKQLVEKIPRNTDTIINLIALPPQPEIVSAEAIQIMCDVYVKAVYNIFLAASELKIKKVVFASSNHATDYYEKDGNSLLNREITVNDYPYSRSVYGALKIAGESLGKVFAVQKGLSVICLRIGTVRLDEREALQITPRFRKTLLSHIDLVDLFTLAIESDIQFGIYYGVSNNSGKPWSIANAIQELGFQSTVNAEDILKPIT